MTDYVVLRAETEVKAVGAPTDDDAPQEGEEVVVAWRRVGVMGKEDAQTFKATSPARAITEARKELEETDTSGVYVAVPARSWSPERRWTESKPIDRRSPVKA